MCTRFQYIKETEATPLDSQELFERNSAVYNESFSFTIKKEALFMEKKKKKKGGDPDFQLTHRIVFNRGFNRDVLCNNYSTSASGITVLSKTPTKYREFFPTLFVKTRSNCSLGECDRYVC